MKNVCSSALTGLSILLLVSYAYSIQIPLGGGASTSSAASSSTQSQSKITMAYVDIEKVFYEHPMTKRLKDELVSEAQIRQTSITEYEAAIKDFKAVIVSSSTVLTRLKIEIDNAKASLATPLGTVSQTLPQVNLSTTSTDANVNTSTETATAAVPEVAVVVATSTLTAVTPAYIEAKEKEATEVSAAIEVLKKELQKKEDDFCSFVETKKQELARMEENNTHKVMSDIYSVMDKLAKDEDVSIIVSKEQILYGDSMKDLTDKVIERMRGR